VVDELELTKIYDALTAATGPMVEPVGMKEFYTRLGIGRTKAFQMKREGILVKGRHYLQFGRKIIFLWGPHLLIQLQNDCSNFGEQTNYKANAETISKVKRVRVDNCKTKYNKQSIIDENYCLKG
jgi:hypothetical protein